MSRIVRTTIYKYAELSDEAKAKARDWYRQQDDGDQFYAESPTAEFKEALKAAGFYLSEGGPYWSGFSSQGNGAAFSASWYASDCKPQALLADRPAEYERDGKPHTCPHNARLHEALTPLLELAEKFPFSSGSTTASNRGHYQVDTEWYSGDDGDDMDAATIREYTETFTEACRDLAHHFYLSLEAEYEYANSDEAVAETIEANEYEFDEEGNRS